MTRLLRSALDTLCDAGTHVDMTRLDAVREILAVAETHAAALPWGSDESTLILDRCNAARARWGL